MTNIDEILKFYSLYGCSLDEMGICETAIPVALADKFLMICEQNQILILGGDIYIKADKKFELFYANWSYEGIIVSQGINTARSYLAQLPQSNLYVSFVLNIG